MTDTSGSRPKVYGIHFRAEKVVSQQDNELRLYMNGIEEPIYTAQYPRDTTLMEMAYRSIKTFLRTKAFQPLIGVLDTNQLILLSSASKEFDSPIFGRNFTFLPWSLNDDLLEFMITNDRSILREASTVQKKESTREVEPAHAEKKAVLEARLQEAAKDVLFQSATRVDIDLDGYLKLGLVFRSEPNRTFFFPDELFHFYYRFNVQQEEYWGVIGIDDERRVVALDQRMPHNKETRMIPGT